MAYESYLETGTFPDVAGTNWEWKIDKKDGTPQTYVVNPGTPAVVIEYGNIGDTAETVISPTRASVSLVTNTEATADYAESVEFGGPRDYRVEIEKDGADFLRTYVLTDYVGRGVNPNQTQRIQFDSSDHTASLTEPWLNGTDAYTGRIEASVIVADILNNIGLAYTKPIRVVQNWSAQTTVNPVIGPLDYLVPTDRVYSYDEEGNLLAPTRGYVLEQILQTFNCQLRQYNMQWWIVQPVAFREAYWKDPGKPFIRVWEYNASGVVQSYSEEIDYYTDYSASNYIRSSDSTEGQVPFYATDITYEPGDPPLPHVKNGSFEVWEASALTANNWTATGEQASFFAKSNYGFNSSFAQSIRCKSVVRASGDLNDALRDVEALPHIKQDIGTIKAPVGDDEWKSFDVRFVVDAYYGKDINGTLQTGTVYKSVRGHYHAKLTTAGDTYYWVDNTWTESSTLANFEWRQPLKYRSVSPNPYDPPVDKVESQELFEMCAITFDEAPPADGSIEFALYGGTFKLVGDDETGLFIRYDDVHTVLTDPDEDNSIESLTYHTFDQAVESGITFKRTNIFGDGPFPGAGGDLQTKDGFATYVTKWNHNQGGNGETDRYFITQLSSRQIGRYHRNGKRGIQFTLENPVTPVSPVKIIRIDGVDYWPVYIRHELPLNRFLVRGIEMQIDYDFAFGSDIYKRTFVASPSVRSNIFAENLLTRIDTRFLTSAVALTSEVIDAGITTQIPLDVSEGLEPIFKTGQRIILTDSRTYTQYNLVVAENYIRNNPNLKINAYTFPAAVDEDSWIEFDSEDIAGRLVIAEQGLLFAIKATAVCILNEDINGAVTSFAVTPLRRNLQQGQTLEISGLGEDIDGNDREPIPVQVSQFHAVGETTLNIVGGAWITAYEGDPITEDGVEMGAELTVRPDQIQLSVEEEREGYNWTRITSIPTANCTSLDVDGIGSSAITSDVFQLIHYRTGATKNITLSASVATNDVLLPINLNTNIVNFPVNSAVRLADKTTRGRIIINADNISINTQSISAATSSIASLDLRVTDNEATVVLKAEVTAGEITKLALVALSASVAGGSDVTISADHINIDGTTTFAAGYDSNLTIVSDTAPATRADGNALQDGDMWRDSDDGMRPYIRKTGAWVEDMTIIKGGNILTRTIVATAISTKTLVASNISSATIVGSLISSATIQGIHIAAGSITAGLIAAYTIQGQNIRSDTQISAGSGNNVGVLSGSDATYRIWSGHATAASAPFRVEKDGTMHATAGEFAGDLTGASMDLSGSLAVTGTITASDVTIDTSGITSATSALGRTTQLLNGVIAVTGASDSLYMLISGGGIASVYTGSSNNHATGTNSVGGYIYATDDTATSRIYGGESVSYIGGALRIDGDCGFYGTAPVAQQTGVAVTTTAMHAALVNLGLITA